MERGRTARSENFIEIIELSEISSKDPKVNDHDDETRPAGSLEAQNGPYNKQDEEAQKDGGFWAWATVFSAYVL